MSLAGRFLWWQCGSQTWKWGWKQQHFQLPAFYLLCIMSLAGRYLWWSPPWSEDVNIFGRYGWTGNCDVNLGGEVSNFQISNYLFGNYHINHSPDIFLWLPACSQVEEFSIFSCIKAELPPISSVLILCHIAMHRISLCEELCVHLKIACGHYWPLMTWMLVDVQCRYCRDIKVIWALSCSSLLIMR